MTRTLHSRLILSHILPLLVVIPLIIITLFYLLQTQVLLKNIEDELINQGSLIASATYSDPSIWQNADTAQDFVDRFKNSLNGDVTLFDPQGHPLASSDPEEAGVVRVEVFERQVITTNETDQEYNVVINANRTEIFLPIRNANQEIIGIVKIGGQVASINENFQRLRWLLLGALVVELLLGAGIGLVLALRLERDLRHVTQAIEGVASGLHVEPVPMDNTMKEFKPVLDAFNTMVGQLRETQEMRRSLLANLVHELGRPLGALRSAIRALQEGADEDSAFRQELLTGMDRHIQRLEPLLDNLAQLHSILLESPKLERQPVELTGWLSELITTWEVDARQKGLRWEIHLPSKQIIVDIDPRRLGQAVENLISNAIKYTEPPGTIVITVEQQDDSFSVQVKDSGVGIAPEEQARIFEPFHRTGKRFPQGMGLGLTIVQNIVTAHGGLVNLTSKTGEGSTFTIRVPLSFS